MHPRIWPPTERIYVAHSKRLVVRLLYAHTVERRIGLRLSLGA